jgi:hypothetical protein
MEEFTEHFKSWLSGFIDGEGCFSLVPQIRGRGFSTQFRLRVRADEFPIIKQVNKYLGGKCHFFPAYKSSQPQVDFVLSEAKNCLRLVKHLEKYPLLAKKKEDFEIWKEAIYLLLGKEHLKGKRDYLLYLCNKIKKVRQYEKVEVPVFIDNQLKWVFK